MQEHETLTIPEEKKLLKDMKKLEVALCSSP